MKTYKNPALKASSVVKASDGPKPSSAPKPAAAAQKKPPVFQLQGKRWVVVSVMWSEWVWCDDEEVHSDVMGRVNARCDGRVCGVMVWGTVWCDGGW